MPIGQIKQESSALPLTTLIFLIDTSGSMSGDRIQAVNAAMREAIPVVRDFMDENPDSALRYNVLEFSTSAKWMTETPGLIEDFQWIDLQASGLTSLGSAYTKLNEKLSRKNGGFLQEHLNNAPILILLSDGGATDDSSSALTRLKENSWFKHAIRIAVEFGDDCDKNELIAFTGSSEGIIPVEKPSELKNLLKVLAINSAEIGSKSQGASSQSTKKQILKEVKNEGFETGEPVPSDPEPPVASPEDDAEGEDVFKDIFD